MLMSKITENFINLQEQKITPDCLTQLIRSNSHNRLKSIRTKKGVLPACIFLQCSTQMVISKSQIFSCQRIQNDLRRPTFTSHRNQCMAAAKVEPMSTAPVPKP